MGQTLTEIAEELQKSTKRVQLIYAFNGIGKTRLSRELKELIDPKDKRDEKVKLNFYTIMLIPKTYSTGIMI